MVRLAVAHFLLLVTPFAIFLQFHGIGLRSPEALACLAILAVVAVALAAVASRSPVIRTVVMAALLTWFADLQFGTPSQLTGLVALWGVLSIVLWVIREHAVRIVTLGVGTVLVSSLLLVHSDAAASADRADRSTRADLPLIVHIILDEHMGLEGLPAEVPAGFKRDFRSFYERNGFLLFGRAFSEYSNSALSISHLLNLRPGGHDRTLLRRVHNAFTWEVTRNAYFNWLAARGYAITVYQPNYLDTCGDHTSNPECHTYRLTSLRALERMTAPAVKKTALVAGMYLDRSTLYKASKDRYQRLRRRIQPKIALPPWNWDRSRVNAISTMIAIEEVESDLARARRGDFVFAHLLAPHYPYIYDANCSMRPPSEWLDRTDPDDAPRGTANGAEGRRIRYGRYVEQLTCVQQKLQHLLDAIPAALRHDAVIIIQGDHGSRIAMRDPVTPGESRLSTADYIDSYAAHFAVRAPRLPAGYERRMAPLPCILKTLVESDFTSLERLDACSANPTVFISGMGREIPRPMPEFGEEAKIR